MNAWGHGQDGLNMVPVTSEYVCVCLFSFVIYHYYYLRELFERTSIKEKCIKLSII